jgi:hypothetical protein
MQLENVRLEGRTYETKAAGEVLTAKQASHRPGITPALSLRADGDDVVIVTQTGLEFEPSGDLR